MWWFPEMGVPPKHPFNGFSIISQPFLDSPIKKIMETPMCIPNNHDQTRKTTSDLTGLWRTEWFLQSLLCTDLRWFWVPWLTGLPFGSIRSLHCHILCRKKLYYSCLGFFQFTPGFQWVNFSHFLLPLINGVGKSSPETIFVFPWKMGISA